MLVFRGGPTHGAQEAFARQALTIATALFGGATPYAPQLVAQLPPDLYAALLELFANALMPRCAGLALLLLGQQPSFVALVNCVAEVMSQLTSPRAVCWSLLLIARLPHWSQQPSTRDFAGRVLEASLQSVFVGMCRLLATSPVARDPEVLSALARALVAVARAPGAAELVQQTLSLAMVELAVPADEREVFLSQLGDAATTEELLCESLRDTADAWHAHLSRSRLLNAVVPV